MDNKNLGKKWGARLNDGSPKFEKKDYDFSRIQSWVKGKSDNLYTEVETKDLNKEVESQYTLSKEDFERDFKWDNFKQWYWMWDCWIVSTLDSFVNNWCYENLIRTHVKKNGEWWYDVTLPMWFESDDNDGKGGASIIWKWFPWLNTFRWDLNKKNEKKMVYRITEEDLLPQISLEGRTNELISDGKKWINCLAIALWKKIADKGESDLETNTLTWGYAIDAMNSLLSNFYTVAICMNTAEKDRDRNFDSILKTYLKNFDKKTIF